MSLSHFFFIRNIGIECGAAVITTDSVCIVSWVLGLAAGYYFEKKYSTLKCDMISNLSQSEIILLYFLCDWIE